MCHGCWLLIHLSDFISTESIIQFHSLNTEISISTDTNSHEDPPVRFCCVTKGRCSSNIQSLQQCLGSGCTNQWTIWLRCNFWNSKEILKEILSWKMTVRGICHQYLDFPYFPCWRNKCPKSCFMKTKPNQPQQQQQEIEEWLSVLWKLGALLLIPPYYYPLLTVNQCQTFQWSVFLHRGRAHVLLALLWYHPL